MWNLMQIQGKLTNINSALFFFAVFSSVIFSTFKINLQIFNSQKKKKKDNFFANLLYFT